MSPDGQHILVHLRAVEAQRRRRQADAVLGARVQAVKRFQHARFTRTYVDLLSQPRYGRATRFFLDELYGPHDFAQRDEQFARVVPALVRLFPHEIVATVRCLAELHALSESLDSAMAMAMPAGDLDRAGYVAAWQAVGQVEQRERQIALMLEIGQALDRYTRKPLLRHSLRMMRLLAQAAGLAALQGFLESGFDTFREMRGAEDFLRTVATRERALAAALFAGDTVAQVTPGASGQGSPAPQLGQLP